MERHKKRKLNLSKNNDVQEMMSLLESIDVNDEFLDDSKSDEEHQMVIAQRMTLNMKKQQKWKISHRKVMQFILEVYRSSASGSASADIRMNFDIRILIRIRNISCGCHADIANNKRIIF